MRTKKSKQSNEEIEENKKAFIVFLDSFIKEQEKLYNDYPRNTKFLDIQLDILQEFKERCMVEFGKKLK